MSDATTFAPSSLYPSLPLPASEGLLDGFVGRFLRRRPSRAEGGDLDRRVAIARRTGLPLVLGNVASPFDGAALPALVERLRREPAIALRLVVVRLRPERDPSLLAALDEVHAVEVDVVVSDPEADGVLETAAALVARGLAVRVVTPVGPEVADDGRIAILGRAAQDVGAVDWVLCGPVPEATAVAHRQLLLGLGLGSVAGRG